MHNFAENSPLVSVIIPSYNRAHFLPRAIESIAAQNIKLLEIVIADDGSTDNTEEVIKNLIKKYPNIINVKNSINLGEAASRNLAARRATGKYLAFLDSDDEWLPSKLSQQVSFLDANSDYDAVATNYFLVDQGGNRSKISSWFSKLPLTTLNLLRYGCNIGLGSTVLIKRATFEKLGYFDESLPIFVDLDWLCRFCEAGFTMGKIEDYLVLYNKSPMRSGEFLEKGIKEFKLKNKALLKKFSILNRALIESQFYGYISHSYLENGPFGRFFYTELMRLLLNPLINPGNHKHLLIKTVKHLFGKNHDLQK